VEDVQHIERNFPPKGRYHLNMKRQKHKKLYGTGIS
jgi:hypothetical protein